MTYRHWNIICRFMVAVLRLLRNPQADVPIDGLIDTIGEYSNLENWRS